MQYTILKLDEYNEWHKQEPLKSQMQIDKRLLKIEEFEHFGHMRDLDNDLKELKFEDGRRIYYAVIPNKNIILLLGGNKNGQEKDIKRARKILGSIRSYQSRIKKT